jgi:hypothetical protein
MDPLDADAERARRRTFRTLTIAGAALLTVLGVRSIVSPSALEAQIAGDGCRYASGNALENTDPDFPGTVTPHVCGAREMSIWSWLDPPLEADCQVDAARCAAAVGDTSMVPALIRALSEERDEYDTGDGKIYVRASFAEALGLLRDERAIAPLIRALGRSNPVARSAAAYALARFKQKARAAGPELETAFTVSNPQRDMEIERMRCAAALALARVAPDLATEVFSRVLREPFANLNATEDALDAIARSDAPLPVESALVELAKQLRQAPSAPSTRDLEDRYARMRIYRLTEAELRRRETLSCRDLDCARLDESGR